MTSRGFVTLAVGNIKYYKLAANLLKSYKIHSKCKSQWAVIADRENEYTLLFDKVIIIEKPQRNYMDKLTMLSIPPFDENIFIDADCLAYRDLDQYWEIVENRGGVRCFGRSLPLNSKDGWFEKDGVGEYSSVIQYIPAFHGGIIYFSADELTKRIYSRSIEIAKNYSKYRFAYFEKPADEPILALSTTIENCSPIELSDEIAQRLFVFYPSVKVVRHNCAKGELSYSKNGVDWIDNVFLLHWQNYYAQTPAYLLEVSKLNHNYPVVLEPFEYIWLHVEWRCKNLIAKVHRAFE